MKLTGRKCLKQAHLYAARSSNEKRNWDALLRNACSLKIPGLVDQVGSSPKVRCAFLLAISKKSADALKQEKLVMQNQPNQQYSLAFRCLAFILMSTIRDVR